MKGTVLQRTERIRDTLRRAAAHLDSLPQNVRESADLLCSDTTEEVSWVELKEVLQEYRKQPGGQKLWLHEVCAGSRVLLRSPPARTKSPALQARLAELQKQMEQRQYDAMVHDVTHAERDALAASEGGMVSYKAQLSVGLHVLVMMGTFYSAGHVGASYVSAEKTHHLMGGLLGLVLAMLMETLLIVIRCSTPEHLPVERALRGKHGAESARTPQCVAAAQAVGAGTVPVKSQRERRG